MPDVAPPQLSRGQNVAVAAIVAALVAAMLAWWWYDGRGSHPAADPSTPAATDLDGGSPDQDSASGEGGDSGDGDEGPGDRPDHADGDRELGDLAEELAGQEGDRRVVVISVDGLGSAALGPDTPVISRLLEEGAGTANARTAYEFTVTLPNHTSMVTGRPVEPSAGGHGVTWNDDTAQQVPAGVDSVFDVLEEAGGSSAVFVGKSKFDLWDQAWPVDEFVVDTDERSLVAAAIADLDAEERDLIFLHLAGPDAAGHAAGWASPDYRSAVRSADAAVGEVVEAIREDPGLEQKVVVVVTADHGGVPATPGHGDATAPRNYTIPFVVWGAGVADGELYALNPDYADPGSGRPSYDGPQPVRNGAVANLVTDLLGLGAVPGSSINAGQDLDVLAP